MAQIWSYKLLTFYFALVLAHENKVSWTVYFESSAKCMQKGILNDHEKRRNLPCCGWDPKWDGSSCGIFEKSSPTIILPK